MEVFWLVGGSLCSGHFPAVCGECYGSRLFGVVWWGITLLMASVLGGVGGILLGGGLVPFV